MFNSYGILKDNEKTELPQPFVDWAFGGSRIMDLFKEQLVKKVPTPWTSMLKTAMLVGSIMIFVIAFIIIQFVGDFGFLVALPGVGALYACYYFMPLLNVEYEYIYTDGEVDIDKIMGKKKRKRLITFKANTISEFGPYLPERVAGREFDNQVQVSIHPKFKSTYYAVFEHHKLGKCLLLFSPNEEMRELIKEKIPRTATVYEDAVTTTEKE